LIKFSNQITSKLNLGIDLGNTLAKFFLFDGDKIILQQKVNYSSFESKIDILIRENSDIKAIIYADVSRKIGKTLEKYSNNFKMIPVNSRMHLPFINSYQSKGSLGNDRIVLAAAACKSYPKSNVLVVDMGTCITYDFIDEKNVYQGGAISPGFVMRYKALNHFTANLPIVEYKTPKNPQGKNTHDCIHSGVYFAILDEITARIEYYKKNYESLTVILTGGDANKLPKTLKNSIFANSNFIAGGLLHLLKLNIDS